MLIPLALTSSISIAFSNSFEGLRRQNDNSAALNANPIVLFPNVQLPVRALPRHADDISEVLLGGHDFSLAGAVIAFRQTQQRLGKPTGEMEKHKILGLISRLPQPRA